MCYLYSNTSRPIRSSTTKLLRRQLHQWFMGPKPKQVSIRSSTCFRGKSGIPPPPAVYFVSVVVALWASFQACSLIDFRFLSPARGLCSVRIPIDDPQYIAQCISQFVHNVLHLQTKSTSTCSLPTKTTERAFTTARFAPHT